MDRHDGHLSSLVALDAAQRYDTHGFCRGYPLRRHRCEALADLGCFEARRDWREYIGEEEPEKFGCLNWANGNFTAVVLPFCLRERIRLVAYVLECESLSSIAPREGITGGC
jgi:hypothetical protein